MQITAKPYTIKLNQDKADALQLFLEENNLSPDNFKEVFNFLLEYALTPKTAVSEEVVEAIEHFKSINSEIPEDIDVNELIIKAVTTPQIKEVKTEVEKQLAPNEVLLSFSEEQLKTLEQIRINRIAYRKHYRKTEVSEPNEILIKKILFDEGVLGNWGGSFFTGL